MAKRLKDHTDEELLAEVKRRGIQMGKQAREEGSPIPTADPTRPGKDMHDPLEGDEISGLEQPITDERDRTQEEDGEVGGQVRDDSGEDVDDDDQTVPAPVDEDERKDYLHGEAEAGQDLSHQTSDDSEEEGGAPV